MARANGTESTMKNKNYKRKKTTTKAKIPTKKTTAILTIFLLSHHARGRTGVVP
jgi:hypothetical protein